MIEYADQLYGGFPIQNKVGILIKKELIKNKRSDYYGEYKKRLENLDIKCSVKNREGKGIVSKKVNYS